MTAPTKFELIKALQKQGLFYVCDLPRFVKVQKTADVIELRRT